MAKFEGDLKEVLRSILFVAGEGVSKSEIIEKLELDKKEFTKAVERLKAEFSDACGIHLIEFKDKLQLASNPHYSNEISDVLNPIRERALTKAALETLAIIAYKQPITRLDIEEIRGVNCDYTVQLLLEHNMIEVVGRKDSIGKPLLFGTTEIFLKRFNLNDLEQLPNYEDLLERIKVIEDENRSDSLYSDFKLPDEEPIPDFLSEEDDIKVIGEN